MAAGGEPSCRACGGAHVAHTCSRRRSRRGQAAPVPEHLVATRRECAGVRARDGFFAVGDTVWGKVKFDPWCATTPCFRLMLCRCRAKPASREIAAATRHANESSVLQVARAC